MAESPTKRQRLTSDSYLSRNSDGNVNAQSTPTTPTRTRSYASPTKASLARSHPNLLSKSPKRAVTEPREKMAPNQTPIEIPTISFQNMANRPQDREDLDDIDTAGDEPELGQSDFATAITQALENAPAMTRAQTPERREHRSKDLERSRDRRPLSSRQPRHTSMPKATKTAEHGASDLIMPKLVKRKEAGALNDHGGENDDLDLPPTPVQLGLTQRPERPKGLASSSSGGSRDGSGRNRRRFRNNGSRAITSSPLKPRDTTTEQVQMRNRLEADTSVEEAPESEADEPQATTHDTASRDLQSKQNELLQLQSELEALKVDVSQLDSVVSQLQDQQSPVVGTSTFSILERSINANNSFGSSLLSAEDEVSYLTLFAPANITLSHTTEVKSTNRCPKIIHELTITPPSPWPSDALKLSFVITIDAKDSRIESIRRGRSDPLFKHSVLQQWMERRLQSPLLQRDIGGLIFGASQYMEACVSRARALHEIYDTFGSDTPMFAGRAKTTYSRIESSYLDTTQLVISPRSVSTQSRKIPKQLLISYILHFDWIGTVKPKVHINCTGVAPKVQKGAKELFQKIIVTEGIFNAVSKIWSLLEFDPTPARQMTSGDGRNQSKKGRRKVVS